jgi:MATE family multidrug resistance protein
MSLEIGFSTAITPMAAQLTVKGNIEEGKKYFSPRFVLMYYFRGNPFWLDFLFKAVNCFDGTTRKCGLRNPILICCFSLIPLIVQGYKAVLME